MSKKIPKNIIYIGTGALILIIFIVLLISLPRKKVEGHKYFTTEPATWIESDPVTEEDDVKIDVMKATRAKGTVEVTQHNYIYDNKLVSFFYHGYYQGKRFDVSYVDPAYDNASINLSIEQKRLLLKNYTKIQISKRLNPSDGIIDALILGKEENDTFVFYIFVDEDWKQQLGYTNIMWGDDFKDRESLHTRQFDFSQQSSGIYIDKVDYDTDWFLSDIIKGGLMVGEIGTNILEQLSTGYWMNVTFVYIR
ncbi:hypothetical protein JW930_00065 [Candidatus Woesearchaeota archaeon]|nr:hypothetical protein [Candidatus Woesearchaeota archaeon]